MFAAERLTGFVRVVYHNVQFMSRIVHCSSKRSFLMAAQPQAIQQHSLEQLIEENEAIKARRLTEAEQKRNKRLVVRYLKDKLPYVSEEKIEQIPEEEKSRLLSFAKRKQVARMVGRFAKTFGCVPVSTVIWWSFALVAAANEPSWLALGLFAAGMVSTVTTVAFFAQNIGKFSREIRFFLTGNQILLDR